MTTGDPSGETMDFPSRLRMALGAKSARSFALGCSISATVLHQYLSGKSEPTRPLLVAIANAAEVDLKWLATGEGPMRRNEVPQAQVAGVDEELLEAAIEISEELLESLGKRATPKQMTQLILALYDLANEREDHKIDRPTALRLVKLVAA